MQTALLVDPDDLRALVLGDIPAQLSRIEALLNEHAKAAPATSATDVMTRTEVADSLRLSFISLRSLEERGELVPVRIGRRVLYQRRDVESLLERRPQNRKAA